MCEMRWVGACAVEIEGKVMVAAAAGPGGCGTHVLAGDAAPVLEPVKLGTLTLENVADEAEIPTEGSLAQTHPHGPLRCREEERITRAEQASKSHG